MLNATFLCSGTGHGVGAALNVHEGPQSISFRFGNMTPLQKGMIVSNEPGYYEDHAFGIRIEVLFYLTLSWKIDYFDILLCPGIDFLFVMECSSSSNDLSWHHTHSLISVNVDFLFIFSSFNILIRSLYRL